MAVGVPTGRINAEYPLGVGIQTTLGTPVAASFWVNQTANTLNYITGAHMIKSAFGTRADEQESAQGETRLEGGFESNLRTATMRGLLEAFFGTVTAPTPPATQEVISVSRPKLLTIEDNWAGESHQFQDVMLNTLALSCTNHLEWHLAWTVLGGKETLITSTSPTGLTTAGNTKAWADVIGITGLSASAGQISQMTINFNNGIKQDYGAGQHAATATLGGEFTIGGSFMVRYDSSTAATVHSDYVAGTDLGPTTLTIGPSSDQHDLYFPNMTLLTCVPQKPLDDFLRLNVTFGVKQAEQFTYSIPA
jgi:Phage tail tube protein